MLLREFLNRTGEGKSAVVGWGRGMGHKGSYVSGQQCYYTG